jgi:hypothetical protein
MDKFIPYRIEFDSSTSLRDFIEFLFTKGFVFTTERIKTIESASRRYCDYGDWVYLYLFHMKCKSMFNTSRRLYESTNVFNRKNPPDLDFTEISQSEFLNVVLPKFLSES